MMVTFLGTASAEGYPATFCHCDNCRRARTRGGKNIRARASLLVNDDLLIDLPPDAAARSIELGVELWRVKGLLITHSHEDHFYPDELRLRAWPFASEPPRPLLIVGNEWIVRSIRRRYKGRLRALKVRVKEAKLFEPLKVGKYKVTPLAANHECRTGEQPLIYIVEWGGKRMLYACDTGPLPQASLRKLCSTKLDLVIVEATLGRLSSKVFPYHMGFQDVFELKEKLESEGVIGRHTPFIVTHFSHLTCPLHEEMEEILKPYNIVPAYDGLKVEV